MARVTKVTLEETKRNLVVFYHTDTGRKDESTFCPKNGKMVEFMKNHARSTAEMLGAEFEDLTQ